MKAESQVNSLKKTLVRQNSNQIKVKLIQTTESELPRGGDASLDPANKKEKPESTTVNDADQSSQESDDELSVDLSEISK